MPKAIPQHALCRRCRYPLRALTELRCPECGQAFDPGDPRTMRLPPHRLRWRRQAAWRHRVTFGKPPYEWQTLRLAAVGCALAWASIMADPFSGSTSYTVPLAMLCGSIVLPRTLLPSRRFIRIRASTRWTV